MVHSTLDGLRWPLVGRASDAVPCAVVPPQAISPRHRPDLVKIVLSRHAPGALETGGRDAGRARLAGAKTFAGVKTMSRGSKKNSRIKKLAARSGGLDQLEQIAAGYTARERFLNELTLDPPDASGAQAGRPELDEDYLILSTIHSAKGQEWDAVFVLNLVDGCIPSDMASGKPEQIDEERRLLYVAMTRAREHLHLLQPLRFYLTHQPRQGRGHVMAPRSRFLPDEVLGAFTRRPPRPTARPMRCHRHRRHWSTSALACVICGADPPGIVIASVCRSLLFRSVLPTSQFQIPRCEYPWIISSSKDVATANRKSRNSRQRSPLSLGPNRSQHHG